MKSLLILFTMSVISLAASAQKAYSISKDEQDGGLIFKGPITMADLNGEPSFRWMKSGMDAYKPEANAIAYLSKALQPYTIVAVMGTWCDDSHDLIPKLAKVLQATKFPMSQFAMWGVDRAKETGGIESRLYDVKRVPTIIVYKGNQEAGRIVESVSRSIEVDIAQILQKGAQ